MARQGPQLLALPLTLFVVAALVAAGAAVFMATGTAHAEVEGHCTATINGVDVGPLDPGDRSDDIKVSKDGSVPVSASSPAGFRSHKVQLEFASRRWTVSEQEDNGSTTWSDTVDVDDYATYGVGIYKVIGVSELMDGTTCEGAATVDVSGNPLATVAGGAAAAAAVVGTVGGLASGALGAARPRGSLGPIHEMVEEAWHEEQAERSAATWRRSEELWSRPQTRSNFAFVLEMFGCLCFAVVAALLTPLMALVGGGAGAGGAAPAPAAPRGLPRPRWSPRITLLGLVGGLLAGAGSVVLLQQFSVAYPTLELIIECVVVGMVVYGIVLPTLGHTIAWWRLRSRVGELERQVGTR
jgi:hypothetical protein